ncbi:uncharacterized protein FIESC28_00184 [Fusarium coffeatum]|uniref:Major facilitator superfamily (MFS) profile domain-containing protein n=1 Tax=Fusarium coffeatum TaxID=231269 RepID=A0A366SE21_9HYPO|nr:uncharacterized protein FIESC28_00184 [Fusarium coffeatum]RBR26916.1 hypothetical protein FIESC28_00184 [Fusarium coffeatum]
MLSSPAATVLSGYLTRNAKIPPVYPINVTDGLQVLGVCLMCSLPVDSTDMPDAQYGYEVLMGVGFGLDLTTVLTFARIVVSESNLCGTVSLAMCATILNNHLRPKLTDIVSTEQAAAIFDSVSVIENLDPSQQVAVRRAFAEGYNWQNIFMAAMAAAGLIASLFLWEKSSRKAE